jgi:hypothetical protein
MAALMFWLPMLVPLAVGIPMHTTFVGLWNTESMGLLPVVLMASPLVAVSRIAATRIVTFSVTVWVLALLASPFVAAVKLALGVENDASYVSAAVTAVEREWKAQTDRPLEILAGPFGLTSSMAFSMHDRPSNFADFSRYLSPWIDDKGLMHAGLAVICPHRDANCLAKLEQLTERRPAAQRVDVILTPRWLGFSGTADHFVIAIMPPQ